MGFFHILYEVYIYKQKGEGYRKTTLALNSMWFNCSKIFSTLYKSAQLRI